MADPFLGEIKMFGGNYAPRNYATCDGQMQAISQNTSLYSLVGTTYGGDGRTTFGLPDMRSRVPIHQGWGPGLTQRYMGNMVGTESVVLGQNQMPSHTHTVQAATSPTATSTTPVGKVFAATDSKNIYSTDAPDTDMSQDMIATAGQSQPHYNLMPFSCINFIIALVGTYPPRS